MDHAPVSELLGAYALDACLDYETIAIEAHLDGCAECRDESERLKNVAGWMGASEAMLPSEHLRSRLLNEANEVHQRDR